VLPGPAQRHLRRAPGDLKKVPGLELTELPEARMDSDSAAAWAAAGSGRRQKSTKALLQHQGRTGIEVGAEELGHSCPYCITALEDSRLVMNHADDIEVKDITEVIRR
jgi:hypothetical protein